MRVLTRAFMRVGLWRLCVWGEVRAQGLSTLLVAWKDGAFTARLPRGTRLLPPSRPDCPRSGPTARLAVPGLAFEWPDLPSVQCACPCTVTEGTLQEHGGEMWARHTQHGSKGLT